MTPPHIPVWLRQSRWFGLAIAGTLLPFTVLALSVPDVPPEQSATTESEALLNPDPLGNKLIPSPDSSLNPPPRSPLVKLKNAIAHVLPQGSQPKQTTAKQGKPSSVTPTGKEPRTKPPRNPRELFGSPAQPAAAPPRSPLPSTPTHLTVPVDGIPLTLEEAIALTVLHNTTIKNAYLDRIVQRADLRRAQGELLPKLTPTLTTEVRRELEDATDVAGDADFNTKVRWLAPTGGTLNLDWRTELNSFDQEGDRGIRIAYSHPLLRYGESTSARIQRDIALIDEDINLLTLRETLSTQITNTITTYRALLLAQEQVILTQASLENAHNQLERQRALLAAGRIAAADLLGFEQNVANFQSDLLGAQNRVKSAQLTLMDQLGSDRNLNVVAIMPEESFDPVTLSLDNHQIEQTSLAQRPDYLQELLRVQRAEINKTDAANELRWNLDLNTAYNRDLQEEDWSATLTLSRNLGDRRRDRAFFKRAEVALLKQQNTLAQTAETIKIEVSNQIREVYLQLEQWRLAQESVQLATQKLAAQEALIRAGKGRSFELQDVQRQLLDARNQELNQRIDYLNALTQLEQVQGITLEQWGILLEPES